MGVVVTTGAVRCAKPQSDGDCQLTNVQLFYRPDALPVAQPTVLEHWREGRRKLVFLQASGVHLWQDLDTWMDDGIL